MFINKLEEFEKKLKFLAFVNLTLNKNEWQID